MARQFVTGVLLASLLGTSLAACSGGGDSRNITWAGRVCDATSQGPALSPPNIGSDPKKAKVDIEAFLGDIANRLKTVEDKLKAVGAPPSTQDKAAYQGALVRLSQAWATVVNAQSTLTKEKAADAKSLQKDLTGLTAVLQSSATYKGPTDDIRKASPALDKAFAKATTCQTKT